MRDLRPMCYHAEFGRNLGGTLAEILWNIVRTLPDLLGKWANLQSQWRCKSAHLP